MSELARLECWVTLDGRTVCPDCATIFTGSKPVALEPPRSCSWCSKPISVAWPRKDDESHYVHKEVLEGLVSRDGVVLSEGVDDFKPMRYIAIRIPEPDTSRGLPTVCGISTAGTLRALYIDDIDERLHKLMGIPWPHEISIYSD